MRFTVEDRYLINIVREHLHKMFYEKKADCYYTENANKKLITLAHSNHYQAVGTSIGPTNTSFADHTS